jgi:competence protein ComEA
LVYVAAALVVLLAGGWALLSARRAEAGDPAAGGASSNGLTLSTSVAGGPANQVDPATGALGTKPGSSTTTMRRIFVQVVGAVVRPGVYPLPSGSRTFDAIAAAGGVTADGDEQAVQLAAVVGDGARVVVPKKGQNVTTGSTAPAPSGGGAPPGTPVSLSDATVEQLDSLPGIGPSTAQQIVAYRDAHGPFTSVEQLDEVSGIGPATLARLDGLVVP